MNPGLYLTFTLFLFLAFAFWIRGLVIRRLRPERILEDLGQEVRALIADLNQAGDHNITILEDRIGRLQDLLERADNQIDDARMLLEYIETRSGNGNEYWATPPSERTGTDPGPAQKQSPGPDAVQEPEPEAEAEAEAEAEPEAEADATRFGETIRSDDQDKREAVLALYRQGLSQDLIAARTGVAIGEVELIISLRARRLWR